jgi:hypothetical protein
MALLGAPIDNGLNLPLDFIARNQGLRKMVSKRLQIMSVIKYCGAGEQAHLKHTRARADAPQVGE